MPSGPARQEVNKSASQRIRAIPGLKIETGGARDEFEKTSLRG
jgi:hypothetical protein